MPFPFPNHFNSKPKKKKPAHPVPPQITRSLLFSPSSSSCTHAHRRKPVQPYSSFQSFVASPAESRTIRALLASPALLAISLRGRQSSRVANHPSPPREPAEPSSPVQPSREPNENGEFVLGPIVLGFVKLKWFHNYLDDII